MKTKNLMLVFGVMAALSACAEEPYLAENLSVWFRADLGVSTNVAGGVTSWANQGTLGSAANVAPAVDNSAAHVAYEADGIGGKPSILFDGTVNLETQSAIDTGVTADGGAWFVVFKTPCTIMDASTNMGVFGGDLSGVRFGIFFPAGTTETIRDYFFSSGNIDYNVYSNQTQIISMHGWKKNSNQKDAVSSRWNIITSNQSFTPAEFMLRIGKSLSWTKVFKGEIAEIRIYNRALTRRERCRIEFELCSRYGESWEGHGNIDSIALSWYEESAQVGRVTSTDEPDEELVSTVSSGGATLDILTPSAAEGAEGYFSNNGGDGVSRAWFVSAWSAIRGSSIKLTFDRSNVRIGANPSLYSKSSYGGTWNKLNIEPVETEDSVSFTIPSGWANGFYAVRGELDSHLAAWYRADMGISTNEAGAVTRWKNSGVYGGSGLDMTPTNDNSAAHIRYEASGMGTGPSISFDGSTHLIASDRTKFGMTANGGAWFVLFKTSASASERGNMVLFGGTAGSNNEKRHGVFFNNNAGSDQGKAAGYMFGEAGGLVAIEENKPQILSCMYWTEDSSPYKSFDSVVGVGGRYSATGTDMKIWDYTLGIGDGWNLGWTKKFVGDVAEVRIYNRPLTARERYGIEMEMCARFAVPFGSYDPVGVSWAANSAILGYQQNEGVPEEIVYSGTAGGATMSLSGTLSPSTCNWTYFSQNGEKGFDGMWYVYAPDTARALPMSFSVRCADFGGDSLPLSLYHSSSATGPWRRVKTCMRPVDGRCAFSFGANAWNTGFYRVENVSGLMLIFK